MDEFRGRCSRTILVLVVGTLFWMGGCRQRKSTVLDEVIHDAETNPVPGLDEQLSQGYVADEKCATCHESIATNYAHHSMGRSLAPITRDFQLPNMDDVTFEANGFHYSTSRDSGRWVHRQGRPTEGDQEMAVIQTDVAFAVGSGNHGCSFIINRDGYLFLSPITWYPDQNLWQLSPGYEKRNSQFNRPVVEVCLYCHANRAPRQEHTLNRYHEPIFQGHAIGCQRCHGPGAQHVRFHESGTGTETIVHPGKLQPALREAVCQQCHLSGVVRVNKPGKHLYDFRPGQPLSTAYTVFTQATPDRKFVGHVEQMYQSRCFQESKEQLGCISCHDPHRLPTAAERVTYFRDRCLRCHEQQACGLPLAERQRTTAEDSCIDCHMPPQQTEVRHAASTDHSIPRRPEDSRLAVAGELQAFPNNTIAQPTPRDVAIAQVRARDASGGINLDGARSTLEEIAAQEPLEDVEAIEALIELYADQGDIGPAVASCNRVLQQFPARESTLTIMADIHTHLGNHARALPFWRRAIEANPHMSRYWYQLGKAYAATNQWFVCRQTMQVAKPMFPTSIGVRQLLIESNLRLGDRQTADREFQELERFRPPGWSTLRDWYESARDAP